MREREPSLSFFCLSPPPSFSFRSNCQNNNVSRMHAPKTSPKKTTTLAWCKLLFFGGTQKKKKKKKRSLSLLLILVHPPRRQQRADHAAPAKQAGRTRVPAAGRADTVGGRSGDARECSGRRAQQAHTGRDEGRAVHEDGGQGGECGCNRWWWWRAACVWPEAGRRRRTRRRARHHPQHLSPPHHQSRHAHSHSQRRRHRQPRHRQHKVAGSGAAGGGMQTPTKAQWCADRGTHSRHAPQCLWDGGRCTPPHGRHCLTPSYAR